MTRSVPTWFDPSQAPPGCHTAFLWQLAPYEIKGETWDNVKDELARLEVTKQCCRKAEVSALLRFGGGLHIVSGKIVIEAELDEREMLASTALVRG